MGSDLMQMIPKNHRLESYQQQNLSSLCDISQSFANDAEFECCSISSVQEDTIILESGHQPNFFPYPGVWKKVFLLDQFRELLAGNGLHGIAFFGFADQNTVTAPFLYKNKVPALNKNGMQKIGFTVKGSERWKCFNRIEKPPSEVWEAEVEKMANLYSGSQPENQEIYEIMWRSYERANSFSDLNAYIFARISREILGFDVFFFRYSDIQHNQIFSDQCKQILDKLDCYNTIYNSVIKTANNSSRPVVSGEVPFWYHCGCGGKTPLVIDSNGVCRGTCPVCKICHELDFYPDFSRFDHFSKNMSLSAVSRNLVFSEGLGTHLFISGSGGGLRYGNISHAISLAIGFNQPLTCSWSSKDYYIGSIHKNAVDELQNTFSLTKDDVLDSNLNERIDELREKMAEKITEIEAEGADKKSLRLYTGRFISSAQTAVMVSHVFSTVPSMFDIYMYFDKEDIVGCWRDAFHHAVPEHNDSLCVLAHDVVYKGEDVSEFSRDEIPLLYRNLCAIGVK